MKTLCVLAVVVVAVAASPVCSSYCDELYSGSNIERRSDCNCEDPQKKLHDGHTYEHDLKSILLPGFEYSEVKHNMIKRSAHVGDIPVEIAHNSSVTFKSSDDVFNNSQINEKSLSDCIDLLVLISIRKNKNKTIPSLEPNLKKNDNINDLEISTEIKNKCDQATAIMQRSVEEIKEHQNNISKKKNQNVNVTPKIDLKSASELTDETPATSTNDDKETNSTVKSTTPYDKPYTNAITTIDNTPIFESAVNDYNLSTTYVDIQEETTDQNYNFNNLNYSVEVIVKDEDNNTSTKLKNIQTTTGNKSSSSYNLNNVEKKNLTYELTAETSRSPPTFPERVQNKSMLMVNYSDNVKESTSMSNKFITNSHKTVVMKTINQDDNFTSLRDRYNENEVPITRIITREYPNNTISSVLNGTETLSYSNFEEETIINNKTEDTSDTELEIRLGIDDTTPSSSEEQTFEIASPTINGRLYFEYEQKHVPGHFVQTPDGRLQLSLDMNTICNELSQKREQKSLLIFTLCQYFNNRYQSMGSM